MQVAELKEGRLLTREEVEEIARSIEELHAVFQVFWGLASIEYLPNRHKLRTAAVCFPRGGKPRMALNYGFWNSLDDDGKLFVIAHECLHVLLDHGLRNAKSVEGATPKLVNIAQDIAINEMIRSLFHFNRDRIQGWQKYCWIDTCFDDWQNIERDQSFVYYLKKLIEQGKDIDPEILGAHEEELADFGASDDNDEVPTAERLAQDLTAAELEALIKASEKSEGRGNELSPYNAIIEARQPAKLDIKDLVEKMKRSASGGHNVKIIDTFAREDRRFGNLGRDFILPGKRQEPKPKKKLLTATFFDVSGSCMSYFNKFLAISQAFADEPEYFDLRQHLFDTKVTEFQLGDKLGVGGGTRFDIIEIRCQELAEEYGRYPDLVVVVTDGDGNSVRPEHPGKWLWILTKQKLSYVPNESRWVMQNRVIV